MVVRWHTDATHFMIYYYITLSGGLISLRYDEVSRENVSAAQSMQRIILI